MSKTALTVGLLADAHCGRGVWRTRYFGDSPAKLAVCVDTFIERGVDMLVNLGDTIDQLEDDPNDPADYLAAATDIIRRFDGDRHTRQGHAAENFSRLSRIALNLLKAETHCKVGIKSKRLRCGWDHHYLLNVLTQGI